MDLALAPETSGGIVVYLCRACKSAHPAPARLLGGPLDDPEPCDACENARGPYDHADDDSTLRAWALTRRQPDLQTGLDECDGGSI